MRRVAKHIGSMCIVFLMLICFGLSIGYSDRLKSMKDIVMLYFDDSPLQASQVLEMQKAEMKRDNPVSFTGWSEKDEQDLYNPEFNRYAEADVVYVLGDSSLVLQTPVSLQADDKDGCLISRNTAYDLFGSMNVKNKKVMLGDRELTVRGLFGKDESAIVVQTIVPVQNNTGDTKSGDSKTNDQNIMEDKMQDSSSGAAISVLTVDTTGLDKVKAEKVVNDFIGRYGITGKSVDHRLYKGLTAVFSGLFPIILEAIVVLAFVRRAIKVKSKPILCILYLSAGFIFLLFAVWICNAHFVISQDMIPNRWSDFDFWNRISQDHSKEIQQLFYVSKQEPEINYFVPMINAIGFSLLSVLLLCISNIWLKINSANKLFGLLCISLIMEFIVILILNSLGFQLRNTQMIWLLYPLYLIGKYAVGIENGHKI